MTLSRLFFVFVVMLVVLPVQSATREEQIAERLSPVGDSCMAGETCAASAGASASAEPQTPEEIYNGFCVACHLAGVADAPKLGDAAAWSDRIAKGMDTLYASGINGLGALMPAMGTCMSCSEDDIKATVDYMVAESQ